ncbi:MAG TPA: lipopolysaccharide assembly protein LapA domain-containing protein [Amycolatopsis sp.]|uniref:LapA family protein n=1 Tax=Amycolatopsis sp. TaxID=37632 RepID=UPI002B4668BE|nr:lipopolysaccharide assembly protein LapA domain-containing protein [Amycolatopsis sp.]HKS46960.1 lipopolysaccharide assembly protein LapA domain-containing protein [Amycolatopsis sp.]
MTNRPEGEAGTRASPDKRTRASGTWVAVLVALAVLVFLVIFIVQNLGTTSVYFLGVTWMMPLAVAMLCSAVAGALIVALAGGARVVQLRNANRKARKALQ